MYAKTQAEGGTEGWSEVESPKDSDQPGGGDTPADDDVGDAEF